MSMVAIGHAPRRPARTPARPTARTTSTFEDPEPPPKRRKYAPGGLGGGGRFLASQNTAEKMAATTENEVLEQEEDTVNVGSGYEEQEMDADVPVQPQSEAASPRTVRRAYSRPRRERTRPRARGGSVPAPRPRYSSAAAAAAASQASDGYKPREEKSWEEFHPDLDIEADLLVFTADEVDGRVEYERRSSLLRDGTLATDTDDLGIAHGVATTFASNDRMINTEQHTVQSPAQTLMTTPKRKPGRPPRKAESMLSGLGSPPAPKITALPTHNPKERLNLPKPQYRLVNTFEHYEQDKEVQINYVDKAMAHVGYQEGEQFDVPQETFIRHLEGPYDDDIDSGLLLASDEKPINPAPLQVGNVEYDMDEQDERWLEALNAHRKEEQVEAIRPAIFEITMTQIEREYYALEKRIPKPNPRHATTHRPRSSSAAAVNGEPTNSGDEPDSKCVICDDGDCENANAIIFCDGCDLAVHQECYGVPFIPEGQWFCRKCKEIGRGTPTCIFCPNIDGAFKQTNTLRWSHLLCAIWIPEVTIANTTFMEPIQDVEKVPRGRWTLHCYICNQRMGACIQCGNKACYQAFHVTCARRAKLFLKMKSSHTAGIDPTALKAFCDRHVPPDWRREHDVDNAIVDAKRYYRHEMRDRRWADSQATALAMGAPPLVNPNDMTDELGPPDDASTIVVAGTKRRKQQPQKTGWRLPSGAPVVPTVVFNTIEASLARFTIRKRKDFVVEACKYWTLKREARRGAALLKRLQLQLESFSSMEITRRNFIGMGAAGRPRLRRRIDFAKLLTKDMARLTTLVEQVREREQMKLEDAENLKQLIDTLYFPISDMLWPILRKAKKLGHHSSALTKGFDAVERKLSERFYTSVAVFQNDIGSVFTNILAGSDANHQSQAHDIRRLHHDLSGPPMTPAERLAITQDQKEQRKVAKRIVRTIKEPLEAALKHEAQLKGIPFEKEMNGWASLDARLEHAISHSDHQSTITALPETETSIGEISAIGGASPSSKGSLRGDSGDVQMAESGSTDGEIQTQVETAEITRTLHSKQPSLNSLPTTNGHGKDAPSELLSPPISASSAMLDRPPSVTDHGESADASLISVIEDPWSRGGVPWYMAPFDPIGTTVHEERWTGPEQIRAMSEALSEMDEDTLVGLQPENTSSNGVVDEEYAAEGTVKGSVKAQKAKGGAKSTPARNAPRSTRGRAAKGEARVAVASAGADDDEDEEEDAQDDGTEETAAQRKEREKKLKQDAYNAKRRLARKSQL